MAIGDRLRKAYADTVRDYQGKGKKIPNPGPYDEVGQMDYKRFRKAVMGRLERK